MYESVKEYFAMGGYGLYIWPCYIAFLSTLIFLLHTAKKQYENVLAHLQKHNESQA